MAYSSPTLDGLLADPLIQAMMRADKVEPADLKQLLSGVADRRRQRALDLSRARVWFCGQPRPDAQVKLSSGAPSCEERVNC